VGEERGRDAGAGLAWELAGPRPCVCTGPRRRRRGAKFWAFGPKIERESRSLFIFCFSFLLKTNLFQNIFKTKFEFLFNL